MKILVTGSAGFIGFHVAKTLLDRGDIVVGLDNFNSYYDTRLKEDRTAILGKYENFKIVRADLCDCAEIENIFEYYHFDKVCHLAAQAGVRHSIDCPEDYIQCNIVGFFNILEACRNYNVKRLVYASSSSVYGGTTGLPFYEEDCVETPISLYAATKKSNELMAHSYSHLYGFQTIGLRFFTVYGPWGRPDMAMWLFTEAIKNDKPIKMFNNGDMYRDFTYIDDIVSGVISAIDVENLGLYEIFNLGNSKVENIQKMIRTLEDAIGKESKKILLPMQTGDVKATCANISKAKSKLGFEPKTDIEEGIQSFVKWYNDYHSIC